MKTKQKLLPALILAAFATQAGASAFQLLEQNASGLGNAYAGSAAVAEDASTIFYNPAGMSLLSSGSQITIGANAVTPSIKFSNSNSSPALSSVTGTTQSLGTGSKDAGSTGLVPHVYASTQLSDSWRIGLGVNAPFGLKTEYDPSWIGRFRAVTSDVQTININPSVSFKLNDTVSLGFGVNNQRIDAKFSSIGNYAFMTSAATYQAVFAATGNAGVAAAQAAAAVAALKNQTGLVTLSGSDDAWGYNLGAIITLDNTSRIGVSYRSSIKYRVTGNAKADASGNATVDALLNRPIYADIELPDTFILSGQKKFNDQWEVLGDIAWTGWSKIPALTFKNSTTVGTSAAGSTYSSTTENFRDTWRVSLGANYQYSEALKLRVGVAYDQTPVKDEFRTPRLPDTDRYWLSFGAQYKLSKASVIDVGYTHIFVKDGTIIDAGGGATSTSAKLQGVLNGRYSSDVNIFGASYSYAF